MKKIILYAMVFLFSLSVVLASGTVTRTVSNENPSFGEMVTVTLTAILTDTDGSANEWLIIQEPIPSWSYSKGDFGLEASRLSIVEIDLSAGTYTYTYTVTAPSSDGSISFSGGQYQVGEGVNAGNFVATGGVNQIDAGNGGVITTTTITTTATSGDSGDSGSATSSTPSSKPNITTIIIIAAALLLVVAIMKKKN